MKIIELFESLNEPLETTFKRFKNHPTIKILLGNNKEEKEKLNPNEVFFIIKNSLFSNHKIFSFIKSSPNLGEWVLKTFRSNNPDIDIASLEEYIKELQKEFNRVSKSNMLPPTKKALVDFINQNGGLHDLSKRTQQDLMQLPNIRPNSPIILYRGILFGEGDFDKKRNWDTNDWEEGNGTKFLQAINKRKINLSWDKCSSWSYSKEIATRFATCRSAHSNFDAMMGWLQKTKDQRQIDGVVGFVISTIARPEDIIVDFTKVNITGQHSDEKEVILKPGNRLARVVRKWTKYSEVDPEKETTDKGIISSINKFLESTKESREKGSQLYKESSTHSSYGVSHNIQSIKTMLSLYDDTKKAYNEILDSIRENFKDIKWEDLESYFDLSNPEEQKHLEMLKKVKSIISIYKKDKNLWNLTNDEMWGTIYTGGVPSTIKSISEVKDGRNIYEFKQILGNRLASLGRSKIEELLKQYFTKFLVDLNYDVPESILELVNKSNNIKRRSTRTFEAISKIARLS